MTDAAILAAWYDHKDTVYRFAWRMTASPTIAEDVLQEVFLALIRTPDRFDASRAPLRAFLLAVARKQVRKQWEKERRWDSLDDYTFEAAAMDPLAGEVADLVARAVQSCHRCSGRRSCFSSTRVFHLKKSRGPWTRRPGPSSPG
jgi:RNA polymerase sigma factor (sigma-70 family)